MNRKFLGIMLLLIAAGAIFYGWLGGFSGTTVTSTNSQQLFVAGKPFRGHTKDEVLGNTFRQVAQVLDEKQLDGVPANIYYNNPDEASDTISAFIGVLVPDTTQQLPGGFEFRTVPGGRQVLRAEVNAHYMLAPNKLYEALFNHAEKNNLKLEPFYVEWFPEDKKGVVEVPVQK
ncbi:GyrI-like domain-containing protein [Pontibacter qinzhouensis]|uniref:GyrI-like domain-containing protein n=1 Tax=Pontibacter qinzhouensis TaxID=2603253 RepID=A0A5C8KG38_9BACT|nr:GyrI-like domain-containing protein [Pontibacter qinzhouensis]TXK52900.1 GyrI-like domain-containing protein [Pontibacter qinzhouensis]